VSDQDLPEQAGPEQAGLERRPPSAAEAKALGHPLRLRILFACREQARTNKQLAESLGTTPGTVHYHVRQLLAQDFLRAEEPRPGKRGSTEQPYRTTGRSWQLSLPAATTSILREVASAEVLDARPEDVLAMTRLGLTLAEEDLEELLSRVAELAEEFAVRSRARASGDDPIDTAAAGESVTLFLSVHRSGAPSDDLGGGPH
jgi:predicted ArsR family transcriptional regulator